MMAMLEIDVVTLKRNTFYFDVSFINLSTVKIVL